MIFGIDTAGGGGVNRRAAGLRRRASSSYERQLLARGRKTSALIGCRLVRRNINNHKLSRGGAAWQMHFAKGNEIARKRYRRPGDGAPALSDVISLLWRRGKSSGSFRVAADAAAAHRPAIASMCGALGNHRAVKQRMAEAVLALAVSSA